MVVAVVVLYECGRQRRIAAAAAFLQSRLSASAECAYCAAANVVTAYCVTATTTTRVVVNRNKRRGDYCGFIKGPVASFQQVSGVRNGGNIRRVSDSNRIRY